MRDLERSLFSAAMLITVICLSAPSPVLAYGTWTMNNDINAINELVQTGVITPNQGMSLTSRAQNVQQGSLIHNNPIANFMNGRAQFNSNMAPLDQRSEKKAIKAISRLVNDGILSNGQANLLRSQLNMRANGFSHGAGGFSGNGFGNNNGNGFLGNGFGNHNGNGLLGSAFGNGNGNANACANQYNNSNYNNGQHHHQHGLMQNQGLLGQNPQLLNQFAQPNGQFNTQNLPAWSQVRGRLHF